MASVETIQHYCISVRLLVVATRFNHSGSSSGDHTRTRHSPWNCFTKKGSMPMIYLIFIRYVLSFAKFKLQNELQL
jgi:hypothetical protein